MKRLDHLQGIVGAMILAGGAAAIRPAYGFIAFGLFLVVDYAADRWLSVLNR